MKAARPRDARVLGAQFFLADGGADGAFQTAEAIFEQIVNGAVFKTFDGGFGIDWSDACRCHDECYAAPGANKDLCDYNLQADMSLACSAQDGGLACHIAAGIYYIGVQVFGDAAFERAQTDRMAK